MRHFFISFNPRGQHKIDVKGPQIMLSMSSTKYMIFWWDGRFNITSDPTLCHSGPFCVKKHSSWTAQHKNCLSQAAWLGMLATCCPNSQMSALLANISLSWQHKPIPAKYFCVGDCQYSPFLLKVPEVHTEDPSVRSGTWVMGGEPRDRLFLATPRKKGFCSCQVRSIGVVSECAKHLFSFWEKRHFAPAQNHLQLLWTVQLQYILDDKTINCFCYFKYFLFNKIS